MKKPINKIALFVWGMAVIAVLLNAIGFWITYQHLSPLAYEASETSTLAELLVRALGAVLLYPTVLAALGALIEIADGIRWDLAKNRQGSALS